MISEDDLYDVFFKIDSSEKTKYFLAIFQALAGASAFYYSVYKDSQIDTAKWLFSIYVFFQSVVFLFFIMLIVISGQYSAIKLSLRRSTGELYDKKTNFTNVSLRDKTLHIIFDNIENEKAYEIGKEVGKDFYGAFNQVLTRKGEIPPEDKLKKWLEYDSSSGLGRFKLLENKFSIKLKVHSPFIGNCPSGPNQQCKFLLGYIDGFCSKLYNINFKSKCEYDVNQQSCIIITKPIN